RARAKVRSHQPREQEGLLVHDIRRRRPARRAVVRPRFAVDARRPAPASFGAPLMIHINIRRSCMIALTGLALGSVLLTTPTPAEAFCGFYVAGADTKLYNNATMVVMMRDDTRTVLAMQNNYQGPPENFAMIVPVPVVLQEDDVKTLERSV